MIEIDLSKKYNKKEVLEFLQYNEKQLKEAINRKLIILVDNGIYGIYFFQFLKNNCKELEKIKDTIC